MAMLSSLWLGLLVCVAALAAPAAFAVLDRVDAGRFVAQLFAREAAVSVVFAAVLLVVHRLQFRGAGEAATRKQAVTHFDLRFALPAGALFCTLVGYYAIQPLMVDARAGRGSWTFGQLHAFSLAMYMLKLVLVAALVWRTGFRVTRRQASLG